MIKAKRLLTNSLSIMINRVAQSVGSFLLFAAIARILGPYALGQYTLAFSFYFLFMIAASEGLKILFTRNLSRSPEKVSEYFTNGSYLQFLFSCLAYGALLILVTLMPYRADTTLVCYLLGLMVIPFALSNVTEAIFQAQEKMYLIAISTVPVYALRLWLAIWGMQQGRGITFVCWVMVISEVVVLLIQWGALSLYAKPNWTIRWAFMYETALEVRTFLAIQGLSVLNLRIPTLILSVVGGEILVGVYSAVLQLMQPFIIVKDSLGLALFPGMTKAVQQGTQKQRAFAEFSIEVLLCAALPVAIGLQIFGKQLLLLVYKDPSFAAASNILTLYGWSLVGTALVIPLSYMLVANGMEKVNLVEQVISMTLTIFLGGALIARYQLVGAAIFSLANAVVGFGIYTYAVKKRFQSPRLWVVSKRPLLIGLLMFLVFKLLAQTTQSIWLILAISTVSYGLVVGGITLYAFGGPSVVLSKSSKS